MKKCLYVSTIISQVDVWLKRPTKISLIDPYSKPDRNDPGSESIQKRTVTNDIGQNGDNKNPSTVSEQAWLSPIQVLTVRPKGIACGVPQPPTNGQVFLSNNDTYVGAKASQTCDLGYDIFGVITLECLPSGHWSAGPANCTIKECRTLFAPLNGNVNGSGITSNSLFNTSVTFTCKPGYQLSGERHWRCESTGSWSGSDYPVCEPKGTCGRPKVFPNTLSTLNSNGSQAVYQCLSGFKMVTPTATTLTCEGNKWTGTISECKLRDNYRVIAVVMGVSVPYQLFTDPKAESYYTEQSQISLQTELSRLMGSKTVFVHIQNLRGGPRSLVLETAILMPASVQSSTLFLIGTKELLQQNKEIYLADTLAKIERIQIDNANYTSNNVESHLCLLYESLNGPCESGFECVVSSGFPNCRYTNEPASTIVAVAVSLSAVIIILIGVVVFLLMWRRKEKAKPTTESTDISHYEMTRYDQRANEEYDTLEQ